MISARDTSGLPLLPLRLDTNREMAAARQVFGLGGHAKQTVDAGTQNKAISFFREVSTAHEKRINLIISSPAHYLDPPAPL